MLPPFLPLLLTSSQRLHTLFKLFHQLPTFSPSRPLRDSVQKARAPLQHSRSVFQPASDAFPFAFFVHFLRFHKQPLFPLLQYRFSFRHPNPLRIGSQHLSDPPTALNTNTSHFLDSFDHLCQHPRSFLLLHFFFKSVFNLQRCCLSRLFPR